MHMKLPISLLLLQMLSQRVIARNKKDIDEETATNQQYADQEVGLEMVAIVNSFHHSWTGDCHSICKTKREELLYFLKRQKFVGYNMLSQFRISAKQAPSFWVDECLRMSKFCASLNDAWETDEFFQHKEEASMDATDSWSARRPLCDWQPAGRFFTSTKQPIATCRVTEPRVKSCLCRVMLILQRVRKAMPFGSVSTKLAMALAKALATPNAAIELTEQPENPKAFCEPRAICQRLTNKVHKYATDDSIHNWFCNAGFFINHVKTEGRNEQRVINKCVCSTLRLSLGSDIEPCVVEEDIRDAMKRAGLTPLRSFAFETIEVDAQTGPSTTIAEAFQFGQAGMAAQAINLDDLARRVFGFATDMPSSSTEQSVHSRVTTLFNIREAQSMVSLQKYDLAHVSMALKSVLATTNLGDPDSYTALLSRGYFRDAARVILGAFNQDLAAQMNLEELEPFIRSLDEHFRNKLHEPSQVDGPANEQNPSMAVTRNNVGQSHANPFPDTRDRGKRKADQVTPDESDVGTLAPALDLTLSLSQPISMTELIQDGVSVRVGAVENMQPLWKKTARGESSRGAVMRPDPDDASTSEGDQEAPLPFAWL